MSGSELGQMQVVLGGREGNQTEEELDSVVAS